MGRLEPTKEERVAGGALLRYLENRGHSLDEIDFDDRPDLRFRFNGQAAGCEIVHLMPSDMQQAVRVFFRLKRRQGVPISQIVIPIEPDLWMKNAIENKWKKVQKYDKTPYTQNLSLLVHMPMLGYQDIVEYDRDEFVNGVAYGERLSTHGFKNIFYWSGKRIIRLEGDKTNIPPLEYPTLPEGYPAYIMWMASPPNGDFRGTFGDEAHPVEVPKEDTKVIRPLTPAFKGVPPLLPKDLRISFGYMDKAEAGDVSAQTGPDSKGNEA